MAVTAKPITPQTTSTRALANDIAHTGNRRSRDAVLLDVKNAFRLCSDAAASTAATASSAIAAGQETKSWGKEKGRSA